MSEKFTKGPWTAKYASQSSALIEIYNTEDRILVAVLPDRGTIEAMPEIEANANLIADAWQLPELRREIAELNAINKDMYEALEDIINQAKKTKMPIPADLADSIHILGERALRKARGEME